MSAITTMSFLVMGVLTCLDFCTGKATVKTFSASVPGQRGDYFIQQRNDVMLLCEAEDKPYTIQITRLKDGRILNISQGREASLTYLIPSVSCEDTGTYECVVDHSNRNRTDVIIADCDLRPCLGDHVNKTMFVSLNKPVQVSLCVLAAAGILPYVDFNKVKVRRKALSNWTWDFQESKSFNGSFNIHITRDQMAEEEYGRLNIRIFSSVGDKYYVDYNIWLLAPGPPDCPTNLTVFDKGHDFIVLSWRPGLDGGSKQTFHVYFSKDNVTWYRYDVRDGHSTVNMTGLQEDMIYYFTVVSSNVYMADVNETICDNMVAGSTTMDHGNKEDTSCAVYVILPICALAMSLFLAVMMMVMFYKQRAKNPRQDKAEIRKREESQVYDCPLVSRL